MCCLFGHKRSETKVVRKEWSHFVIQAVCGKCGVVYQFNEKFGWHAREYMMNLENDNFRLKHAPEKEK